MSVIRSGFDGTIAGDGNVPVNRLSLAMNMPAGGGLIVAVYAGEKSIYSGGYVILPVIPPGVVYCI